MQVFFQVPGFPIFQHGPESGDSFCHDAWVWLSIIGVHSPQPSTANTSGTNLLIACSMVSRWPG